MTVHSKIPNNLAKASLLQQILVRALSGALGAGISAACLYPFENMKTRQQFVSPDENSNPDNKAKGKKSGNIFVEFYRQIKIILEKEGLSGFYSGFVPYITLTILSWGTFFGIFEFFKNIIGVKTASEIWWASFVSGILNVLITIPFHVLSNFVIRYKKDKGIELGMWEAVKKIICESGIIGFYRGLIFS